MRMSLALDRLLEKVEIRYGEGYYNAVLLSVIDETGLAEQPVVADIVKDLHRTKPNAGNPLADCIEAIQRAFHMRGKDLVKTLGFLIVLV